MYIVEGPSFHLLNKQDIAFSLKKFVFHGKVLIHESKMAATKPEVRHSLASIPDRDVVRNPLTLLSSICWPLFTWFGTARIIATALVHSKLDYCNFLYYRLPSSRINQLQVIPNSFAGAVTKAPRFCHISPVLQSLHWLKIEHRIVYKLISLTYTALQNNSPSYLANKLEIQTNHSTRSASVITLRRPPVKLETGRRSFSSAAPFFWNSYLPSESASLHASNSLTSTPALSRDTFHKQLKTHLFSHSYPP